MRKDEKPHWIGVVLVAVLVCMIVLPRAGFSDYITNVYQAAILRLPVAYPDTFLESQQRFGTEPLDSVTVSIPLDDGTKTIFVTSHSETAIVYGYISGAAVDTIRIEAGTGFVLYVQGRDSLRVERPLPTMFTWIKNPSYEGIAGSYMNSFSKAFPMAHGDTIASGVDTISYSARRANQDSDHPGYCHTFNTMHVSGYGNAASSMLIQAYHDEHLIAQFKVPSGDIFYSNDWTFDSLKITEQGNITYGSFSVSWNNGLF